MIALNTIIGEAFGVVERIWDQFLNDGLEGLSEISDHLVWFTMSVERSAEEPSGCDEVGSA